MKRMNGTKLKEKKGQTWLKTSKGGDKEEEEESPKTFSYISFCYSHSKLGTTASSLVVISLVGKVFIQPRLLFDKTISSLILELDIDVLIDNVDALLSPPNQTWPRMSCVKRRSSGFTRTNDRSSDRAFKDIVRGISGRHRPILINKPTKVRSQNGYRPKSIVYRIIPKMNL